MSTKNVKPRAYSPKNKKHKHSPVNSQMAKSNTEKYTQKAKNAVSSGDRVLAENYFQFAEHYMRVFNSFE